VQILSHGSGHPFFNVSKTKQKQELLYLRTIYDSNRLSHPIVFSCANETLESVIFLIDLGNLI